MTRKMMGVILLGFGAIVTMLAVPVEQPAIAQEAVAEWTFLMYMASDNNLEAAQLDDLIEMAAAGGSDQVQIVALVDRSESSDESEGYTAAAVGNLKNWTTAKLLQIRKQQIDELADWGEVNTGDPATLRKFLTTAMKRFPAKKYALIFGDHGAAWPGVCGDESHADDMLTMTEIHETLKALPNSAGRFELIGFDACLMGNLECAFAIAPFAKVMVASEELEPGFGWHYTPVFERLVADPTLSGAEVGKLIVETFQEFYAKSEHETIRNAGLGTTLSAIDLTKLDAVLQNLQRLAKACRSDLSENGRDSWLALADAQSRAEEYGKNDETGAGSGLRDVGHLVKLLRTHYTEGPIDQAAQALEKSLKAAVIANKHGKGRSHAHGLSIFFPESESQLNGEDSTDDSDDPASKRAKAGEAANDTAYANTLFAKNNPWLAFVADYTAVAASDTEDPILGEIDASETKISPGETITITSEVHADDIQQSRFYLARRIKDIQIMIGEMPAHMDDDDNLSDEWNGKWFILKAGDKELICPITDIESVEEEDEEDADSDCQADAGEEAGSEYFIEVPAQIQRRNKETWVDVSLYFYVDFAEDEITGEFVYAFKNTKQGPTEVPIKPGDKIRPLFLVINDQGDEKYLASDREDEILEIDSADDLSVGMDAVPPGKYDIGFFVYDYSDNYAEQYIEIEVTK